MNALRVRIEASGAVAGTHVYDTADGAELTNVLSTRFEHRLGCEPVVVLELRGGAIRLTDALRGLAETRTPHAV